MSNFNICKSKTVLIIVIVATSLTEAITLRRAEVLVNESALISCLSKEVGKIQWHHTPPGKKSSEYAYAGGRFYPPYNTGRFRLDNKPTTHMYTLIITNIMHEDAGLYECKDDDKSGIFSSTILTVLESSPVCTSSMNPSGFVGPNTCNIEQENMTFSCAVSFTGNSPNLMWSTLNGSQTLNSSICEIKDNRINCSLSMKADPSFDGSTFICQTTTLNYALYNCSIEDIRVEYFLGDYESAEKRVGDNVTCVVASNLQIHYNWTVQQNNEDNIFGANQAIYFQRSGSYKCSVKYNIRDVNCHATIVTVNVSNIFVDEENDATFSKEYISIWISIGVSVGVVCLVAVIAFFLYTKCIKDYALKPDQSLGVGAAKDYFFDFLRIVIPGVWNSLVNEIRRPSAVKEPTEKTFLIKKMLIIIPKTLLSRITLTDDTNFRRTNLSIRQSFHLAGKEKYHIIPIYQLTDKKSGNVYYFVGEIPECLFTMRIAYDSKLSTMSKDDVFETRNNFFLMVETLLDRASNHSKFANQWELLLWPDDKEDSNRMQLSEFVSQEIKSKDLAVKLADILKQPSTGQPRPESSVDLTTIRSKRTVGGISSYPMYSERPRYVLRNCPRGYCIIISNFHFLGLEPRCGAATEIEALKKLFEGLKFKVDARENFTKKQMVNCLIEYRDKDHSGSDAFVCCLLSHGEKGRINATDRQLPVLKLMELFYDRKCPGLAGKPKLFFIGTCQGKGGDEKHENIQSTSAEPNPPDISPGSDSDGRLLREGKSDPYDATDIVRDLVPSSVDFIVSYACLPETVAWNDSNKGSFYVQTLCEHLNRDLEIDVVLRNVSQEVRDLLTTYNKEDKKYSRQAPFHIITPPQKRLFLRSA